MKKVFCIVLLLILSATLIGSPVYAGGDNAKGAVKADLVVLGEPDTVVGSVVLNTTANGYLIAVINMDDAPGMSDYDVRVFVNRVNEYSHYDDFINVLNTNAQGHGNCRIKVDLQNFVYSEDDDYITVIVVLRPYFTPTGGGTPCYVPEHSIKWYEGVAVPLK